MRRWLVLMAVVAMAAVGLKAQNDLPGPVTVYPDQANSNDACLRLVSLATSQMVVACAPASLSSTYTIRFPGSNSSGVLTNDGSGNLSWGSGSGAPFTDASPLIKNDSDATKLAIISAASISTMTTRNYLLPDFDMTFAARDVDNNFTSLTQTFGGRINLGASGNSGPGIRDNAGVLECTDDGSTWLACGPASVTNYWSRSMATITTATANDILRLDSHLLFTSPNVSDIGDSTNYVRLINSANGDFAPAGLTGNYLKARKLEVADDAGGINFWDIQSQATVSTSNFLLRDNAGAPVIRVHRTVGSTPVDYADIYVDLLPDTGGGQKLGQSGKHWNQLWATDTYTNYLHTVSGSDLNFYANLLPITNNAYDIGSSSQRVKKIWTVDLDCSGTCPGSGSGGNYSYTPTAYNNTTWEHALHTSINGADSQTIIQGIQGVGQFTADGLNVAHDCPDTATNWECGALSGVISHGSVTTNAVALRGYVVQSADGTGTADNQRVKGWGLNTLFADKGFDYGYGITEFDYNIDGSNTKVIGVSVGGNGTGTISSDSAGFVCNTLNVPKWPVCFTTLDGTSSISMSIGTTSTGNNVGSQPFYFYGRNSGGTTQRGSLKIDANGNTIIEAGAFASPREFAILADGSISVFGNVHVNFGHVLFASPNTVDVGTSVNYARTVYARNVDVAPSGVTGNYTKVRKLEIADLNGGTTFWDTQVSQLGSLSSFQYTRDNAGTVVQRYVQVESGGAVINQAQFMFHLVPGNNSSNADNTYTLGTAARSWSSLFVDTSIVVNGNTFVDSSRNATVNNLTVLGSCAVCSGAWTTSGGFLVPSTLGQTVAIRNSGGSNTISFTASTGEVQANSFNVGGFDAVDPSRNGRFTALFTGAGSGTQRIDGSGNVTANSIVMPGGIYGISSLGNGLFANAGSIGITSGANVNVFGGLIGGASPSSGMSFYLNGTQLRVRFASGTDKEVSLI